MVEFLLKELSRYNIGTYGDIIYRNALLYPYDLAFKLGSESVTFSGFNCRANRLIHYNLSSLKRMFYAASPMPLRANTGKVWTGKYRFSSHRQNKREHLGTPGY